MHYAERDEPRSANLQFDFYSVHRAKGGKKSPPKLQFEVPRFPPMEQHASQRCAVFYSACACFRPRPDTLCYASRFCPYANALSVRMSDAVRRRAH
jgi:hypothetical protein